MERSGNSTRPAPKQRKRCVPHSRGTASEILEEGGDDVKSAWPLWAGPHTCYNGNDNGKQGCKAERIRKDCLSSDCSLQLGNMKLKSLVIADQHAAVNMYPGPVHTARHTLRIGFVRSIGPRSRIYNFGIRIYRLQKIDTMLLPTMHANLSSMDY